MMRSSISLLDNDLNLQIRHSDRVKCCFDIINSFLPHSEIYLFGSYAKRKIKDESDIDILVLTEDHLTSKELQEIRWKIEDELYAANDGEFELDLKAYTKEFYQSQLAHSHFFMEIEKYKKDLRDIKWN